MSKGLPILPDGINHRGDSGGCYVQHQFRYPTPPAEESTFDVPHKHVQVLLSDKQCSAILDVVLPHDDSHRTAIMESQDPPPACLSLLTASPSIESEKHAIHLPMQASQQSTQHVTEHLARATTSKRVRSRKRKPRSTTRMAKSLRATHPAMCNDSLQAHQLSVTNHTDTTMSLPDQVTSGTGIPRNASTHVPASKTHTTVYHSIGSIVDPTAQTHAVSGVPPLWTASAMMSSKDYSTTHGIVLSPTFMIGLPCGGMIELAHYYRAG